MCDISSLILNRMVDSGLPERVLGGDNVGHLLALADFLLTQRVEVVPISPQARESLRQRVLREAELDQAAPADGCSL
ncbi:hypothetical protein BH24ACT15_BH24ACT15_09320 [soil metagenome]|jgi:hypothetical protein